VSFTSLPLSKIVLLIWPFLDQANWQHLVALGGSWWHWELFGNCPISCPRPPWRRRLQRFGKLNPNLVVGHTMPSPYFVMHKAWEFLTPSDRAALAAASPTFTAYAQLRRSTATVSIADLQDRRPPRSSFVGL